MTNHLAFKQGGVRTPLCSYADRLPEHGRTQLISLRVRRVQTPNRSDQENYKYDHNPRKGPSRPDTEHKHLETAVYNDPAKEK